MRIAVLGPLEVQTEDGAPLTVPGAKERLLLAVLVAGAPDVVSTDRIVESLWDGDAPATARRSLHAHVVRLRSALEPDRARGSSGRYVVRRGTGYALAAGRDEVDATLMADLTARGRARLAAGDAAGAASVLREALALWRGEPFGDWPDAEFADTERRSLTEVRHTATTALLEARLALGEHADVVPQVERLLAQDPLQESWWRILVIALYRCGRQADALAAAQRARRVLADELGADPGPELAAAEAAVLAHDPVLTAPAPVIPRPASHDPAPCPYKGLATYQASDAAMFHGRRRLVSTLVARLVDAPVLVVSGPSGAGKSSVVRAGLVPALAAGALPGSAAWSPVVITPGRRPVDALRMLTGDDPPGEPALLVCDQFEELWAPRADPAERTAFLDTVLGLLDDGIVVRCVVVLRGDQVGRLAEHPAFAERLGAGFVLVPPLTEPELRDVVREPAATVGLAVDDELVDAVVADVHGRPGALPLLSTALVGTWEQRRGNRLTLAGYLEAGGVSGAVTRSAESAWESLDAPARELARRLLVRLADTGEGGVLVRRPLPLVELDLDGERGGVRRAVVEAFVARRLLSVSGDRLDVAHEALLSAWPRLARWLEDDAAGRALRTHLTPTAMDWERRGRPEDELYRGARLGGALEWAADHGDDLTDVERRFLDASKEHSEAELRQARDQVTRERRARRRARRLAAGLAVVLVLALVAGGLAVVFQRAADVRADEAVRASLVGDANRLAALSAGANTLDLSLLLAVQGVRLGDTQESADALLGAVLASGRALRVLSVSEEFRSSTLSGRGRLYLDNGISVSALPTSADAGEQNPTRVGAWGRWAVADASPTEDLLVGAGNDIYDDLWVRLLTLAGTTEDLVGSGDADGVPIAVSFTTDGSEVLLVVATAGPGSGHRWRLVRFDVGSGARADTDVTGTLATSDVPAADISVDGSTAVVWGGEPGSAGATLVDLDTGRSVNVQIPEGIGTGSVFRALEHGAVQMGSDGTLTLYGADGRPRDLVSAGGEPVLDVVVSPDGTWAASVGGGGRLTFWDVDQDTGHWVRRETVVGHAGDILNAEVTADGNELVTVGADDRIVVWDPTLDGGFGSRLGDGGGRPLAGRPHVLVPGRLAVAPTVAAPLDDVDAGIVSVAATFFDLRTGRVVEDVEVGAIDTRRLLTPPSLAVSPNARFVAVSDGQTTTVLDASTRDELFHERLPRSAADGDANGQLLPPGTVTCLTWTPDSAHVVLCTNAGTVTQPTGALVAIDVADREFEEDGFRFQGLFDAAALSPDHEWIAVSDLRTSIVNLFLADSLELVRTLPAGEREGNTDVAFSPDGRLLAVTTQSGRLHVVDVDRSRPNEPVTFPSALVQAEWLPDGRTLAVVSADGEITLVDAARGQLRAMPVSTSAGRPAAVYVLAEEPNALVVMTGVHPARRWPLDTATLVERACAVAGRDLTRTEWAQFLPDRPPRPTCSDIG